MKSQPWLNILGLFAILPTGFGLLGIYQGYPAVIFMLPLMSVFGPYLGLTGIDRDQTLLFKCELGGGLLLAVALAAVGIARRSQFRGQLLAASGLVLWCICGCIGWAVALRHQ